MKYVDIDPVTGTVSWDSDFEYIRAAQSRIPSDLCGYVSYSDNYSLNGANSMHAAWLVGVQLLADSAEIQLEFLGAAHDRKLAFRYLGVVRYRFDLDVRYAFGYRDVLAHEFQLNELGLITHEIRFHNDRYIVVTFKSVVPGSHA